MKKRNGPSFADLLNEPTWSEVTRPPTWRTAARRGRFNGVDEFFDPEGRLLRQEADDLDLAAALQHVRRGARVAVEGCGCRTYCPPIWLDDTELSRLRLATTTLTIGRWGASIELWSNDSGRVVFAVGDLRWGTRSG